MNRECSDCGDAFRCGQLYAYCTHQIADERWCRAMLCMECQDRNRLMYSSLYCWEHIRQKAGIKTDQDRDRSEVE